MKNIRSQDGKSEIPRKKIKIYINHVSLIELLPTTFAAGLLGSLSDDNGNSGDDALLKMYLYFTFECDNFVALFSMSIGLKHLPRLNITNSV